MSLTPAQRSELGRIGAYASWARTPDRAARTQPARDGLRARFERETREQFPEATDRQVAEMVDARHAEHMRRMSYRRWRKPQTA